MAYVNTDTQVGSNKRAIDAVEPWRFGKLPEPLCRYGCTAKCAPKSMGPPSGRGARRLPQPIARTTAKWCAPMGGAPIGAHRGVHQAPPTGMAAAPKPPTGMASAETPAAPIGKASAPTGKAPTGNVSAEGAAALGGRAVSDPLPLSLPAAIAWLRQQAPTQEAQLAALNARLRVDYDDQPGYRPREARCWARALGVPPSSGSGPGRLSHDELRIPVLAAAALVLEHPLWSSPAMAPAVAAGATQLQDKPFPLWRTRQRRKPTGRVPTGKARKVRVPKQPKSDDLPESVPEAMAWLRQQAATHEAQLAALDARLCEDYDQYSWRRSREARAWAVALGVLPDNKQEARELALKFKHYNLRPRVLAAAKALLDQLASEELAHL